MNDVASGYVLLANALRLLIAAIRDTRQRVLISDVSQGMGLATDDEAVHDFRVALRRCRTMLRVARFIWNSKQIARLERELRYFARLTGALRDDEVLRDTLASLPASDVYAAGVHDWLEQRGRRSRTNRRKIMRVLRDGPPRREVSTKGKPIRNLTAVLDKLERLIDVQPATACSAEELARTSLDNAIRDVHDTAQPDVHDVPAMHTLRIREKRLRYTAELFINELGENGRRLVAHATRLQRRLGELHDFDEAIATITRARSLAKSTQRAILASLNVARSLCAAKVEPHLIEARTLVPPIVLSRSDLSPNTAT